MTGACGAIAGGDDPILIRGAPRLRRSDKRDSKRQGAYGCRDRPAYCGTHRRPERIGTLFTFRGCTFNGCFRIHIPSSFQTTLNAADRPSQLTGLQGGGSHFWVGTRTVVPLTQNFPTEGQAREFHSNLGRTPCRICTVGFFGGDRCGCRTAGSCHSLLL